MHAIEEYLILFPALFYCNGMAYYVAVESGEPDFAKALQVQDRSTS
jgi:hypothetical protein